MTMTTTPVVTGAGGAASAERACRLCHNPLGKCTCVAAAGASAAELAVMREAATAFARRSGGGASLAAGALGMLAAPFRPPQAGGREEYLVVGCSHRCAAVP